MLGLLLTVPSFISADRELCGCSSWQAFGGAGFAWSMDANICAGSDWAQGAEGFCGKLGESPFYFVGFSKNIWRDWLNIGFKYTAYNGFTYQKHQTRTAAFSADFPYLNYTRSFDLDNTSYLFNVNFIPQFECLENKYVAPVVGFGLGISHFILKHYTTVGYTTINDIAVGSTATLGKYNTNNSFAAEATVGLQSVCSENVSFGVFYNFYYGGRFSGPCRVIENGLTTQGAEVAISRFCGTLKTNQLAFKLEWNF